MLLVYSLFEALVRMKYMRVHAVRKPYFRHSEGLLAPDFCISLRIAVL
jgi:hypothetical protein